MLRTVWKKPSIRWMLNGNHFARPLAQRRGRDPEHPPVFGGATGREVHARRRPRPGTRPPTRPGAPSTFTTVSSCPVRRTRSTRPSSSTHQSIGRLALAEEHRRPA